MRIIKSLCITLIITTFYCLPATAGESHSMPWLLLLLEENTPPVADAGTDQTVKTLVTTVYLDGTNSSDADNDTLTYNWTIDLPGESTATLSSPDSSSPHFTPDIDGIYTLTLIVNDGKVDSEPDTVVITSVSNFPPVADAGEDQYVILEEGLKVNLDGSNSSDADGDDLIYYWSIERPEGSSAVFTQISEFAQLIPDIPGDYFITLIVNDHKVNSEPDNVVIYITSP